MKNIIDLLLSGDLAKNDEGLKMAEGKPELYLQNLLSWLKSKQAPLYSITKLEELLTETTRNS